jgi:methylamine---glutamate N-methyltransferase subunit B
LPSFFPAEFFQQQPFIGMTEPKPPHRTPLSSPINPASPSAGASDKMSSSGAVGSNEHPSSELLTEFAAQIDWGIGTPGDHMQMIQAMAAPDPEADWPNLRIFNANRTNFFLSGLSSAIRLQVDSPLGSHVMAYASQGEARIQGDVGHCAGDGLCGGVMRIRGNAGDGAGVAMTGGTVAIYGSAGDRVGALIRGGGVFVRGNVGDDCGYGALGGMIVIGGNAGQRLGMASQNVSIFIRGKVASLADGMTEAPLRKRELLRLGMVMINASIRGEAKDFRRIVPVETLDLEKSRRGEINPSWR